MLTHLAVWGDPIDHSRSPDLHAAAYRVLGLDWVYGRRRVAEHEFARELEGLGPSYRGLSLTMPLKQVAHLRAFQRDRHARLTGAVNTYLLSAAGPHGFNTDVGGLVRDLRERGFTGVERARIIGAGSTATSALVALAELGAKEVEVVARRRTAVGPLQHLGGDLLGVAVTPVPFFADAYAPVPLTVAALPGGAPLSDDAAATLADAGGALYDVVYGHWPSVLGTAWQRRGGEAWDGLGMLLQQAVLQVRIFVGGAPDRPLENEDEVIAAMRAALAGDAAVGD
ncbi:shikimate dehydrogenase [Microbacterium sp. SORGH_AS_0888]|uniref:shikimate dehydrogenase n=1 Tax=Microbacterium sp. SORGH_AS_0888 TaxID=3041791 RepID=UPI002788EEA6|nr:shikimate dehydrogenase [Microbacterium sp. SORGH_AS_0888]MDQ1128532.1 shikimate dehydrogenase [Microbacterium sp. SORGH_AS_0888]